MQNASFQATGEAMPALTRRSFLATTAGAGAATLAAGTAVIAAPMAGDSHADAIDRLLAEYLDEAQHERALSDKYRTAWDSLPAWARPGPDTMFSDGSKGGQVVIWPEKALLPTPDPDRSHVRYTIRISPAEAWRRATLLMPAKGPSRQRHRIEGFKAVRRVIARMRHQKAEKERAGIPQLGNALEASADRLLSLEERILTLTSGATPTDVAAVALFEFLHEEDEFSLSLLRRTLPHLSGLLRVAVTDIIAKGSGGVRDMMMVAAVQQGVEAA